MSVISIHAPREGSDWTILAGSSSRRFQSTLPVRGATEPKKNKELKTPISIHAPREGSDRDLYHYGKITG